MPTKYVSTVISCEMSGILQDEYEILSPDSDCALMPRRETIGKRLKTARLNASLSVPQLREKIARITRAELGESTIRDIENDKTPNPGFKTVEFIAIGLGLDPLEVLSLGLEEPPHLVEGFKESQFGRWYECYSKIKDPARKAFLDEYIQTGIEKTEKWR